MQGTWITDRSPSTAQLRRFGCQGLGAGCSPTGRVEADKITHTLNAVSNTSVSACRVTVAVVFVCRQV